MQDLKGIFDTLFANLTRKGLRDGLGVVAQNEERGLTRNGHQLATVRPIDLLQYANENDENDENDDRSECGSDRRTALGVTSIFRTIRPSAQS